MATVAMTSTGPRPDVIAAHDHCRDHRVDLADSSVCGCFQCCRIFDPELIVDWLDPAPEMVEEAGRPGQTARCPWCGIDAVIGDRSGFAITQMFLEAMRTYWF